MQRQRLGFCLVFALAASCGPLNETPPKDRGDGSAGSNATGGSGGTGGRADAGTPGKGGSSNTGGAGGTGGVGGTGGASGTGGVGATGGVGGTGGATGGVGGTGGGSGTGGAGGASGKGGAGGTAGASGTSGTGGTGGSSGKGGASGAGGAGGTSGAGGSAGSGGASGAGGSGGTPPPPGDGGTCSRPVGSCTAPTVKVTDVALGIPVTGYGNESDTAPIPLAIAAMPSGGSRVAWLGTDSRVYVAQLDCNDNLVGTPFSFPGINLQDLYADDSGGVVLLTRESTGSGTHHCGSGMLCGGTSSPCREMYMVRFDNAGQVTWETQVTNLTASLEGYTSGARFVWWYQHHGRLAFDGANYAAYFGVAITVANGACVDIHQGDRMKVVSGAGALLTGHDSFETGCSHSWGTRIVWDPRTSHFVMVCATDNSCRIARPNPYRTIATGTCDGTLFGGDLVLAAGTGYWTAWSQGGTIRLQHFTDSGPDTAIDNAGSSQHPHLVSYGATRMLLTWGSGSSMAAQVRDSGTGAAVGAQFTIAVNDHDFLAFKAYSDGSVAYPASGANNTSIKIARVMPCQ